MSLKNKILFFIINLGQFSKADRLFSNLACQLFVAPPIIFDGDVHKHTLISLEGLNILAQTDCRPR